MWLPGVIGAGFHDPNSLSQLFEVVEICYEFVSSFILMHKIKLCLTLELKILRTEEAEWPCSGHA